MIVMPRTTLRIAFFTFLITTACSTSAFADDLDKSIKALLTTAYDGGDSLQIESVIDVAIATWPEQEAAILAFVASLAPEQEIEMEDFPEEAIEPNEDAPKKNIGYYISPKLWNTKIELGGSLASGTTREKAVSLGLDMKREFGENWEHLINFDLDYAERLGITSKNRMNASYEIMWKPWKPVYIMSFTQYEQDRFTGYDYRLTQNFGLGYQIFKKDDGHAWRVEVGPGYRVSGLINSAEKDDEFLGRFSTTYELPLGKNIFLKEHAALLMNESSRTVTNKTEISAKINSHMAAKLTYGLKYDRLAPVGTPKTSTTTRASLVYDF